MASEGDYPWYLRLLFAVAAWFMNSPWTMIGFGGVILFLGFVIIGVGVYRLNSQPIPISIETSTTSSPATNPQPWNMPASAQGGPVGPIFAAQFVQLLDGLPKPCLVKVSAPPKSELGRTIAWLAQYGGGNGLCTIYEDDRGPPNIDEEIVLQTNETGIVIHSHAESVLAKAVAHFFNSSGFNVKISNRMPPRSPPNLLWIDIGPGSPWK